MCVCNGVLWLVLLCISVSGLLNRFYGCIIRMVVIIRNFIISVSCESEILMLNKEILFNVMYSVLILVISKVVVKVLLSEFMLLIIIIMKVLLMVLRFSVRLVGMCGFCSVLFNLVRK